MLDCVLLCCYFPLLKISNLPKSMPMLIPRPVPVKASETSPFV
jgi:hypothetical protein